MCEQHSEFAARGAAVIAVGGAADYQAAKLQSGFPATLLLDPEGRLRSQLDLDTKLTRGEMMDWESGKKYVRSLLRRGQGRISRRHAEDRPALVILDSDLSLVWGHEGRGLGDYPPVGDVMAALPGDS